MAERGAQLLGREPGDEDLDVRLVGVDRGGDPLALPLGQPLDPAPQCQADPVERVILVACLQQVPEGLLLHPAADLVQGLPTKPSTW